VTPETIGKGARKNEKMRTKARTLVTPETIGKGALKRNKA